MSLIALVLQSQLMETRTSPLISRIWFSDVDDDHWPRKKKCQKHTGCYQANDLSDSSSIPSFCRCGAKTGGRLIRLASPISLTSHQIFSSSTKSYRLASKSLRATKILHHNFTFNGGLSHFSAVLTAAAAGPPVIASLISVIHPNFR